MELPRAPAWFRHRVAGEARLGILDPGADEPLRDAGTAEVHASLAAGELAADHLAALARDSRPIAGEPDWMVPVPRPGKILCLGKNFAAHAAEFGAEVPDEPIFFTKLIDTLIPHRRPVMLPHWLDSRIDHEIELCVVLGWSDPEERGAKYVEADRALELVAGYTIINDVTARRMQGDDRGKQRPWLRCKSFDTFGPIGPCVVPRVSLPDVGELDIELSVNGERRQHSNTRLMVVDVPAAIIYLSRHTRLRPGDLIAMGTPEGVGPITDGDEMCGRIAGIGELRSPVRREDPPT